MSYEEKIAECTRKIQLNPNDVNAYYNRGFGYNMLGQYERAIPDLNKAIDKAIQLIPNDESLYKLYMERGISFHGSGKYARAIEDFTTVIQLNPNHSMAYTWRGICNLNLKNYSADALIDFNTAIQLDPSNSSAYTGRGMFYENLSQYKIALGDYVIASQLNPSDAMYERRDRMYKKLEELGEFYL